AFVGGDAGLLRRLAHPGDRLLREKAVVAQVRLGLDAGLADGGRVPLEGLLDEDQRLRLVADGGQGIGSGAQGERGHGQERSEHLRSLCWSVRWTPEVQRAGPPERPYRAGSGAGAGAGSSASPWLAVSPLRSSAVLKRIGPTSSFIATVATAI